MSTADTIGGFYHRYSALVGRYRGGMPVGFFCSYGVHEGGLTMGTAVPGQDYTVGGDPTIGEVGIFQVTREATSRFGFDPALRFQLEWNFFLGGLNLNTDCAQVAYNYGLVPGSPDAWKFALLWYGLGKGAANIQWRNAGQPDSYQGMIDYADSGDVPGVGRVTAEKERQRLYSPERYWQDGVRSGLPMATALPYLTPAPVGGYDYIATAPPVQGLLAAGRLAKYGGIGDADQSSAAGVVLLGVLAAAIGKAFS